MKNEAAVHPGIFAEESLKNPVFQAYQILHLGYVVLPVLAGLDKFFFKLTDWSMYLWEPIGRMFGGTGRFMSIVGVIEILAGCLTAFKPKIGAPIVALWLLGITVNLLLGQGFYDIALRDFGLFLGALALGRLASQFDRKGVEHLSA